MRSFIRHPNKAFSLIMVAVILINGLSIAAYARENDKGYIIVTDTVAANTGEDVSDAVQALIDSNPNRTIFFPDGEYCIAKPILTPAEPTKSVSLMLSGFAVIKAIGSWPSGEAMIQLGGKLPANDPHTNGSNYFLDGGIIDGSGMANGVSINSGRETVVRNTSIKHTVIGLHIMYGANSGSSDADISGVNIIGTGKTDSIGVLLEGYDNSLTNMRINYVYIGVHLKSAGNVLRNIHPLYYSDYTDYADSCGFIDETGNNWYNFCYSDQFGTAFRTTGNGGSIFTDCYCFWYSSQGEVLTAFRADKEFNSTLTNFNAGFRGDTENHMLTVGKLGGRGTINNLIVDRFDLSDSVYKLYCEDSTIVERIFSFLILIFHLIGSRIFAAV